MRQKTFTLFLALIAYVTFANAETINRVKIGDLYYNLDTESQTAAVVYEHYWSNANYYGLTDIVIPSSINHQGVDYNVVKIIEYAFEYNTTITSVTIPSSITTIERGIFNSSPAVQAVIVASDNPNYSSLNGVLFNKDQTLLIYYPKAKSGDYTIPNTVVRIDGEEVFANCNQLTSVTIPKSVLEITSWAFCSNANMTSINVASDNPNFCSIDGVLFSKDQTEIVKYPAGRSEIYAIPNSVVSIAEMAFGGCQKITTVHLSNGLKTIKNHAFRECTNLISIEFPGSVTSIGESAFYKCTGLSSITCNATTPPSLGSNAFGDVNKSACSLYVPSGSESAYQTADQWKDFTNILPIKCLIASGTCGNSITWELSCEGVLTISGNGEMPNWSSPQNGPWYEYREDITSIFIGNGVTSIGEGAFYECSGLTSVTIPSSVTSIGRVAFYYCSSLTSVTIPNSVTSIEYEAFSWCTGLMSVTIPNSVTTIGEFAFANCSGLTCVTCEAVTPPTLGERYDTFYGVNKTIPLYVPGPSIDLYKAADQWKDFMNIFPILGTEVVEYPVIFLDYNSDVLSEQSVEEGNAAVAPEVPEREGYIFKGWNVDIEHIVARTFAIALYDKVGVEVTYKAEDGETIFSEHADLHFPDAPSITGKTFAGWLTENVDKNGIVLRATYTIDNPTTNDDVTVVPGSNSANVTFPFVTGAITYVLVIRDLFGHVVCKIMFNASGRLLGIAFAPNRERSQTSSQADNFQFTVEGLDPSTTYEYEFIAHDETDDVIETLAGSFTTTAEVPADVESTEYANLSPVKVIENDQVLILRGDKTYTLQGQEVK